MRQARMRAPQHWVKGYYHCISRVVGREFLLGEVEKEYFVKLMRRQERFCQVRVVAFCVMDNHFHLLVDESPQGQACLESMDDEAFFAHLDSTVSSFQAAEVRQSIERWRAEGNDGPAEELKHSYFRRMGNVSFFMKGLKQEFTQWFNRRHKRHGTLWESRFKSVLINGGDAGALMSMAAYIDLNPVRAGIVDDPKDYRWCSYGQARAGRQAARVGLKQLVDSVFAARNRQPVSLAGAADAYWREMAVLGEEEGLDERSQPIRPGVARERIEQVVRERGSLTRSESLLCRVRYFTDGAVLGSKQSVDELFNAQRWRFGPKRSGGARKLRYVHLPGLHVLRDLRVNVLG